MSNASLNGFRITSLHAQEILDSRGRPTLKVELGVDDHHLVSASVPAGVSTGSGEAAELRGGDKARYGGLGVRNAVANVNGEMAAELLGRTFGHQSELDGLLIDLDGTVAKSRLGANAVIGVSMAGARALAGHRGLELWQELSLSGGSGRLPVPSFNVLNGGAHAGNQLEFQEFMVAPVGARDVREAVRAGSEIHGALGRIITARGLSTGLGDEGGYAPEITRPEEALDLLVAAIDHAGYRIGRDGIAIAIDVAASALYHRGQYSIGGQTLSTDETVAMYADLTTRYPIWSLEDPLAENDWDG